MWWGYARRTVPTRSFFVNTAHQTQDVGDGLGRQAVTPQALFEGFQIQRLDVAQEFVG
jgi:hypothetical protein